MHIMNLVNGEQRGNMTEEELCLTSVLIILIYYHGYVEILQMLPDFAAKASIIR